MANYSINILNGTGSQAVKKGDYTVTVSARGYDASTLNPKTFTATGDAQTTAFTVAASGTLTFIVNETLLTLDSTKTYRLISAGFI